MRYGWVAYRALQILRTRALTCRQILSRAAARHALERVARIVSREDLLLSKVMWGRESGSAVQISDARQLAGLPPDWSYVNRWAAVLNVSEVVPGLRS